MPELPEVETVKNQLTPCIINKTILHSKVYSPKLRYPISVPPVNSIIKSITRRSKYIICQCVEDSQKIGYWILHLGMTGFFQYFTLDNLNIENKAKHTHADIYFKDGVLRYIDARRFGAMLYTYNLNHNLLNKLGIEPLELNSEELALYLYQKAQRKKQAIKLFITNNEIIVGIGNIYASEILFESKINPQTLTNQLSLEQYKLIAVHTQYILNNAIKLGGSTIDNFTHLHVYTQNSEIEKTNAQNEKSTTDGYFQIQHKVYAKENQACLICKTKITRIIQGQRSSFFCSQCQK